MTSFPRNVRDLWGDSVWFRICTATLTIGICIIVRSMFAANTQHQTKTNAQNAVQQFQDAFGDDASQLTADQETLLRQGIDSLTPDQRKRYDDLVSKLGQPQNASQ